jgi:hypothetical protein
MGAELMQLSNRVTFIGQHVTLQRSDSSPTGYVAVGWDKGIPVVCRPIALSEIDSLLSRYPAHLIQ